MAKKRKKKDHGNLSKQKVQNLVAKHSRNMAGAGAHVDKTGDKAPRARQKHAWKKDMKMIEALQKSVREVDPFDQAIKEVEKEFNINLSEMHGKCGEGTCGGKHSEEEEKSKPQAVTTEQLRDIQKLVAQYKKKKLSAKEVAQAAGDDLEMLEYSPDQIEKMVRIIAWTIF